MPTFVVTGPDGKKYRVNTPQGASQQQAIAYVADTYYKGGQAKSPIENIPVVGEALAAAADIPLSFGQGLAGIGKAVTDVFGAGNQASDFLAEVNRLAGEWKSAGSKQDAAEAARIQKEAEGKGVWEEVKAAVQGFALSPLETQAQVAGSAVPFIAAALAAPGTGGTSLIPIAAMAGLGGVAGVGAIKGDIYDAMYEATYEQGIKQGLPEVQAKARAEKAADEAQAYGGENLDQIALGGALGAAASATGFTRQIAGTIGRRASAKVAERIAMREAAEAAGKEIPRQSLIRGGVAGVAEEAIPEAIQAGQERYAQNLALQRAGYDVDPWQGVAGQAAAEGIASILLGGYGGVRETQQKNAAATAQQYAAKVEALPDDPTDEDVAPIAEWALRRGFNEEEAALIAKNAADQKRRVAEAKAQIEEEAQRAAEERAAGVEMPPEPDISGAPPVDEEEQAARERAYAEEMGVAPMAAPATQPVTEPTPAPVTPVAEAAPPVEEPVFTAPQPQELTPQRALQIFDDPVQFSDFQAATGMDERDAKDTLTSVIEGETTGIKYSRPVKLKAAEVEAAGQESLFGVMPTQTAERLSKAEELTQRKLELAPEERVSQLEESLTQVQQKSEQAKQRDEAEREERRGDIEYALRAQAPENAVYDVRYEPGDTNAPYKLVAQTRLGKKPELIYKTDTLQDMSDYVYGNMERLTPYIPKAPARLQELETQPTAPTDRPTFAAKMMQDFANEVNDARDAGQIDNNQRAELLNRMYRPNAYRTDAKGNVRPNDAIAKLEARVLKAEERYRAEETDEANEALTQVKNELRAAVQNGLINPARAALKSMVEMRQDERFGAQARLAEAQATIKPFEEKLQIQREFAAKPGQAPTKFERVPGSPSTEQFGLEDIRPTEVSEAVRPDLRQQAGAPATGEAVFGAFTPEERETLRAAQREAREAAIDLAQQKVSKFRMGAEKPAQPVSPEQVQGIVDTVASQFKGLGPVTVVKSVNDIADPRLRRAITRDNAHDAKGFVAPDGGIHLVTDNIESAEDAKAVLFHEGLGHVGLAQLFRDRLDTALAEMHDSNPQLQTDTATWVKNNPDAYRNDSNPLARAVEEVLAERSEKGQLERNLFQKLAAIVRNFARKLGMKLAISNNDVAAILSAAHERVIRGHKESALVKGMRYVGAERARATEAPKYSRKNTDTSEADAKKLDEAEGRVSDGQRKVDKSFSTYGLNDGFEDMSAGHRFKDWAGALLSNWNLFSPAKKKAILKVMPTSGILGWVKPEYKQLHAKMLEIDETVQKMNALKQRIINASEDLARQIQDFVDRYGLKELASVQAMARVNEVAPDEFDSMEEALKNNAVIKEIEARLLKNTNDTAKTRQLIDELKDIVVRNKDSVQVKGDKYIMSKVVDAKLGALKKLAVDSEAVTQQAEQLAEMTRRVRDVKQAWEALGKQKNGHEIYKEMRSFYKDMFEAELALLDERINTIADKDEAIRIKDMRAKLMREVIEPTERKKQGDLFWDIDADLFQKDYFPFMREGQYWLRVIGDKNGTREREFYTFTTERELREAKKKVAARLGVDPEDSNVIEFGYDIGRLQEHLRDEDVLMQRVFDIVGKARAEFEGGKRLDLRDLTDSIYQTWLLTTPERSVRRRLMHAEEVVGFSPDVFLHFRDQATTYANQLSKLAYAGQIHLRTDEARELIKDPERPASERARWNMFVDEIEDRTNQELRPDPQAMWVNIINRSSYYYYLTSAKTALLQLTSIPIRVVPRLWRDYGYAKGTAMWIKYMKMWNSLGRVKTTHGSGRVGDWLDGFMPSVNGSQFVKNSADLRWALKMGMDRGILETAHDTLVQSERATPGKTATGSERKVRESLATTGKVMSFLFNGMENISRQASYYMTFELALEKYRKENAGATDEEARNYAFQQATDVVRNTLGDYTSWERPSIAKGNVGRSLFLFKMHPITQTKFMVGALRDIIKVPEERAGAIKELSGVLMMAGMFGGLMGMPLYSAMTYALMAAFGPDEEDDEDVRALMGGDPRTAYDPDIAFRSWMNETFGGIELGGMPLADILVSGPISTALNTELASSTTLDLKNMWFRDAVVGDSLEDTVLQTLIANVAGLSMLAQFSRGYDSFKEGNIRDGLKAALPAFFRTWVNAAFNEAEGVKNRRGDTLIPKEDISAADNFRDALGFRAPKLSRIQQYYITRAKNETAIKRERTAILDRLERAYNNGELRTRADVDAFIKEEVAPFNRTYPDPEFLISEKTMNESIKRRAGIRARTFEGMQLDKKTIPKDVAAQQRFVQ